MLRAERKAGAKALGPQELLGSEGSEGEGSLEVRRGAGGMQGEAGQGLVATGSSGFGPSVRWGP